MPSLLAIVHQPHSTTGCVGTLMQRRGYEIDMRCVATGDRLPETLAPYTAVAIFGGPMSANDDNTLPYIKQELDWIPDVLEANKPLLGICLGAQLLARALGATVAPHGDRQVEIGYFPISATEKGRSIFQNLTHVYHWHQEGFDLPTDATLLATGSTFPHQAFQYGQNAYGLQFHPEINHSMIQDWTTNAADQLTQSGAQSLDEHFLNHQRYALSVERWLDEFLEHWLSPSTGV
ncbi:MAG: gamma-glutamyl-gamma-aminobutyrate hydrolase family protein [Leptolyngbyaceae bacterium]|nr:gamma-glutamyl-gamma-aminobutyrate hydrolase family protein [Leptolyngbyaceae bacterium]